MIIRMDVGIPSPQAVLIISFNIFRVLCRRYGIYLCFGFTILIFQGFSGYYILYYGVDENISNDGQGSGYEVKIYGNSFDNQFKNKEFQSVGTQLHKRSLTVNDHSSEIKNEVNLNADPHNKGPPNPGNDAQFRDFGFTLPCEITNKEVISALQRSRTLECKKEIANISCEVSKGTFYPTRLVSFCPTFGHIRGRPLGCFKDNVEERIFGGYMVTLKKNSPFICADICFQRGFTYAGVQYSKECFCGNELPTKYRTSESECSMKCAGMQIKDIKCGGYLRINVFETGLAKMTQKPLRKPSNTTFPTIRIAYILTVNGRSLRQIIRLFKTLFHKDHFFIFHIDSRQDYLYRELLKLEKSYPNVILSRKRFSSIWGGSSLLKVLLHCMKEVLLKKEWNWDFVINLSESDFPIKSNKALVEFLTANRDRNFLKSHGHDTNKFLQKQGLDRTFLECETHMWRIGERRLPLGIRIDGGSDWVCLNRQFVEYIALSNDMLVNGLKKVFLYTLLPGESFFHTVLRNSEYCQTFTDNNLHVTNWKRKLGCRCQYKHIVDWCGCSPNDFTLNDWAKLEGSKNRNLFFGRKFEAVKSLEAINMVDEWLYGKYDSSTYNLKSFWDNLYHYEDAPNGKDDVGLTLYHSTMRLTTTYIKDHLSSKPSQDQDDSHFCEIIPVLPIQAHSYHDEDQFKGVLVEFMARTNSGDRMRLETLLQPKKFFRKIAKHEFADKLIDMQVNTNFDLKEQIFRNFGGHLGPQSEIWVALWLTVSEEEEVGSEKDEERPETELELVLVDSLEAIAAYSLLRIMEGEKVATHTFTLSEPYRPGIWTLFLIHNQKVIASVEFPILPLQFVQGRQISVAEGRKLHSGPNKLYSHVPNEVLEFFKNQEEKEVFVPFLYPGNTTKLKEANEIAMTFGPKLSNWIDKVMSKAYHIEVCLVPEENIPTCLKQLIRQCTETRWSFYSPDPKTQLSKINYDTGRMTDPFRLKEGS